MGYQIGSIFGGALAPFIAVALYARFGTATGIAVYMAALCAITFVSVLLLTETRGTDVDDVEAAQERQTAAGTRGPATG